MAIDAASGPRRSVWHRKLCGRFGWRTRRTAGVVPAMCMSLARRGVPPPSPGDRNEARTLGGEVMLRGAWCVALFAIGGRASSAEPVTKVATRLFLDAATAGIGRRRNGARNNHEFDLSS